MEPRVFDLRLDISVTQDSAQVVGPVLPGDMLSLPKSNPDLMGSAAKGPAVVPQPLLLAGVGASGSLSNNAAQLRQPPVGAGEPRIPVTATFQPGKQADRETSLHGLRLVELAVQAQRMSDSLAQLASVTTATARAPVTAALIRQIIRLRRERDRFFPPDMFADPAWDILLDLAAARLEDRDVSVTSLCLAAAVPNTTALRWIRSLTDAGLLERRSDPVDARRIHIVLSEETFEKLLQWLKRFAAAF